PCDGPGGMVAHAFFPGDPQRAGHVHFDSDEDWTFRSPDDYGTDLFAVAVHEFGHSLGLSHSPAKRSIMRPYYEGPVCVPCTECVSAQQVWGRAELTARSGGALGPGLDSPELRPLLSEKGVPDRCSTSIDAVAHIRGETFFFTGQYFWRLSHGRHLTSLRPALSAAFWRGLPRSLGQVDAAYERHTDHRILFFSGEPRGSEREGPQG
uniref:Peptidase M10 metallopeptidase domain-containing protein n=1 Tax=Pelodiscus sinensis TaxID=13735 RepID=K7FWH5_PELSI